MTALEPTLARHIRWAILFSLLVNAASLFTPIINEGDSVLYAALSQHIALTGNWGDLVLDKLDWLDKPHFPFWVTALFFKIGGVSTFNYILPGFLFHLLGSYYTYRIARMFYGRHVALIALLMVVSAYHLMYTSSAIKAEAFLTGSITAACYYWLRFDTQAKAKYLLLAAMFSAISVMTKGIFTLITIASGLACVWIYRGQWRNFWSAKWLLALALSLLFTFPEVLALYSQFDAHPEKVVFGKTGVSGIRSRHRRIPLPRRQHPGTRWRPAMWARLSAVRCICSVHPAAGKKRSGEMSALLRSPRAERHCWMTKCSQ